MPACVETRQRTDGSADVFLILSSSGAESLSSDEKEVAAGGTEGEGSAEEHPAGEDSSENSSSSSLEEESDAEELDGRRSDEEQEEKESLACCNESGVKCLPPCEHCRNENDQKEEVTPRMLSGGQYVVQLDAEGTYQCSLTGLIFEVTGAVKITYSLLSWSKYANLVEKPWIVGGPLFDVRCDSTPALTSIQFPHSLCLGDHGAGMAFKVLHVKGEGAAIEPSADYSASHVKWLVSSLSPVGPLIQSQEPVQYHGAVILYKVVDEHPSLSFRVYVATNNDSFIKDISRAVKHSNKKFIKIDKPPVCQKLLQKGKRYRLICEPEAEITPEEIEFVDGSLLKLKSYIEVYLEKPDDFTLSLVELESDATVWKARLRESDWIHYDQNKNEQKRSTVSNVKKRKPALSILEEDELCSKKQKTGNTADGIETKILTDQQLMVIAKLFGRQWREIAIECLQMEMKDIEQIQAMEEEVNMQKFLVLSKWRDREQGNGTAEALYRSLREKASHEILQALQGIAFPLHLFNYISVFQVYFKNSHQRVYQIPSTCFTT
ncbi:caspase recruitment domain-containing protein 8-like isoform X1 [Harpia harpyja]|uniref:caspase recruitment domain-containing protein 8-like isoform X1 n=1 Tax=Harpia harpyja TaxID=202280 RepID=UPI0022B142F8|nr:caspase recruitment domain-containing protein 8-like isoform X1 [Harpia harpyja]